MGIRYEKDTILDWVDEMGKFLRLLVEEFNAFSSPVDSKKLEDGYMNFFQKDRDWMHSLSEDDLLVYVNAKLHDGQVRSLALLFLYDAKYSGVTGETKNALLRKTKLLLNYASERLGQFSFEDYGIMADIESELVK